MRSSNSIIAGAARTHVNIVNAYVAGEMDDNTKDIFLYAYNEASEKLFSEISLNYGFNNEMGQTYTLVRNIMNFDGWLQDDNMSPLIVNESEISRSSTSAIEVATRMIQNNVAMVEGEHGVNAQCFAQGRKDAHYPKSFMLC